MRIILSHPRNVKSTDFVQPLSIRWAKAVRPHGVSIFEPQLSENHGALLSRLWLSEIRPALEDGENVLVSELDVVPDPLLAARLAALEKAEPRFVFSQYVTRIYQPGSSVKLKPGKLKRHEQTFPGPTDNPRDFLTVPLIGPWFMWFPHGDWVAKVPDYWLDAAGPFNDAANLALAHLRAAGVTIPATVMRGQDLWPLAWGVEYPGLGAHLFFMRHLDDPDDATVCWPECNPGLTGKDVRDAYAKALNHLPQ